MDNLPEIMVSVFMMTYNHEKYIAKAIDSVLMQKTNFSYEIIVGEDGSSDNTLDILISYAKRYPSLVNLIVNKKNIGAKANQIKVLEACRGKYIAMLEGDDFWIDPDKLQKQVDFLESNPAFSMCFTNRIVIDSENENIQTILIPEDKRRNLGPEDVIGSFTPPTQTVLFRRSFIDYRPDVMKELASVCNGDTFLFSILSTKGEIGYLNSVTAAYRTSSSGAYSGLDVINRLKNRINTFKSLLRILPSQYHKFIYKSIKTTLSRLFVLEFKKFRLKSCTQYFFILVKLDITTNDLSTLKAIRLLFKSFFSRKLSITD
jgi:glycosyltransferase involved in cell wall biosynthesis